MRPRPPRSAAEAGLLTAHLLDGRAIAGVVWEAVGRRAAHFQARAALPPGLAIIRAEGDPASDSYLRQIARQFGARGLATTLHTLSAGAEEQELDTVMARLAEDEATHGILVQLPLPPPFGFEVVAGRVPVGKDVDGIHPLSAGALAQNRPGFVPSAPLAGLEILRSADIPMAGRVAVVVGRSSVVGRPMAQLMLREDATVVTCHSRTPDLGTWTRQADILLVGAGRPGLISATDVKPGTTVVDFGINALGDRIVGDVDFESVRAVAGAITPVPGGTGPVTTAVLARKLVEAAERTIDHGR